MKKLMLALLVAVAVGVPNAEATFQGTLGTDAPWSLTVTGGDPPTGQGSAMIMWLRQGRLEVIDTVTLALGEAFFAQYTLPKNVDRVIIAVDPVGGSFVDVTVQQGACYAFERVFGQVVLPGGSVATSGSHGQLVFNVGNHCDFPIAGP